MTALVREHPFVHEHRIVRLTAIKLKYFRLVTVKRKLLYMISQQLYILLFIMLRFMSYPKSFTF